MVFKVIYFSKCRKWEKDRRDRFSQCFIALGKVLPCYDPSVTLNKIQILEKAASYITELEAKVKDLLLSESLDKTGREEIKRLSDRIKKLILRNEQLSNLLKDAGISIPSECGRVKKIRKALPWSNKISPEEAKILAAKASQS